LEMPGSIKEHVWSYPLGGARTRQEKIEHGQPGNQKSDGSCSAFLALLILDWRLRWKTFAGRFRAWQAAGLGKALARVRLTKRQRSAILLLGPVSKGCVERRNRHRYRDEPAAHPDHSQFTMNATPRRASSDEQEKQLSRSEIAKKPNRFSGARKTPGENSVRTRSPIAPWPPRERILIWQGFIGVRKNRCI